LKLLANARSLILSATPTQPGELRTLFSEKDESIKRKLESPPVIRENGWSFRTLDQAKIVRGEMIRLQSHRFVVDLYRDGTLIFGGYIFSEYLAWSDQSDITIHPLALVEVIANFTRFYKLVIEDFRTAPDQILFSVALRNLHLDGKINVLPVGPVGDNPLWLVLAFKELAPANNWTSNDLFVSVDTFDPEHVAYLILSEIYGWFGHSDEDIPYLKNKGDIKGVDTQQISEIGRRKR
jgi:hypothetical protein